jgi:predicted Zn finger-like uncharacterized protein
MKFLCDNCKAKYQIGDDKVAGKTVRMKCRRCGYSIKVSSASGEGSDHAAPDAPAAEADPAWMTASLASAPAAVAAAAPRAPIAPPPAAPAPRPAPSALAAQAVPSPPAAKPTWNDGDDESTSIMTMPLHVPSASASSPARAGVRPAAGIPAARPSATATAAPHTPRPVTAAAPVSRPVSTPRPGTPRPVTRTSTGSMAAVRVPIDDVAAAPGGGVAGAFARAVADPGQEVASSPRSRGPAEASPVDQDGWYVGIAGAPLGPVPVSTIRDKAMAGAVDGESLVWREGFEEWRPLKMFPELLEVVSAAHAPRAPAGPASYAGLMAAAPMAAAPMAAAPVAVAPTAAPVAAAPVAAPHANGAAAPLAVLGDPFASPVPHDAPASNGKSNGAHLSHDGAGALASLPGADAAPAPRPHASDSRPKVEIDPEFEAIVPRRRQTHPMAYAFIASAAVFSGVAAYVLLSKPQTQIVVVQQSAAATSSASASPGGDPDKGQVDVGEPSATPSGPSARPLWGKLPKASASASPSSTAAASTPLDTSGFNTSVPGPAATAPQGSQGGGGGQLSQGEISGVVAQNQPLVKRKCWQPALEARPPNGSTNARVNGSITIGASGNVENATASGGEKDFPGLSSCIASRMRGWRFPPSGGSTTVNVPFVFAGQ